MPNVRDEALWNRAKAAVSKSRRKPEGADFEQLLMPDHVDRLERRIISVVVPGHYNQEQTDRLIERSIPSGFKFDASVIPSMFANKLIVSRFDNSPFSTESSTELDVDAVDYTFNFGVVREQK